ncbi:putative B3 domain-containing protein At3g49610 [Salvia hispanica]|uniref:putative B3 domain-containing protein At3g49610 n=1 Tax=Salvia hispanica TaxID=49212 RepID=UPI002009CFEA|nr:putative B3 domain-containing protein At3g49610 [Salvia hispanica]
MKHKLDMRGSLFDVLLATTERAAEILESERSKQIPRPKRKIEKPSSDSKRRKTGHHERPPLPGEFKIEKPSFSDAKRRKIIHNNERPPLPEEFKIAIEEMSRGADAPAKLVIQKQLYGTDLSSGHNRLSIPMNQIADDFLTEGEKEHLRGYDSTSKKKKYLDVKVVGPSLSASETVKFSRWDMAKKDGGKTSSSYVINGKWNAIVAKNKLRIGVVVQLWCFRVDRELCFALVRLPPGNCSLGA